MAKKEKEISNIVKAKNEVNTHYLFGKIYFHLYEDDLKKEVILESDLNNRFRFNRNEKLSVKEYQYWIIHSMMHACMGHYFLEKYNLNKVNNTIWHLACDFCVDDYLQELGFKFNELSLNLSELDIDERDELVIYEYLLKHPEVCKRYTKHLKTKLCGVNHDLDGWENYEKDLDYAIRSSIYESIHYHSEDVIADANNYFVNHYPLFAILAQSFRLISSQKECDLKRINVAAIDLQNQKIYCNSKHNFSKQEWIFILAHEYLHAGLNHGARGLNKNFFLWNVACDFVVNDWLVELEIGRKPDGVLYDEFFHSKSVEEVYEIIMNDFKRYLKVHTFKGQNDSDMLYPKNIEMDDLDEFYARALSEGFSEHTRRNRGFLPAQLIEEIKTLQMPAIKWEVELAKFLDEYIKDEVKQKTYTRLSRRSASTPNIIRPGYKNNDYLEGKTFGVVLDTSLSMDYKKLGKALGSIVACANSKNVKYIRLIFCDAKDYDQGYVDVEQLLYQYHVKGRGGTRLQDAIDLLNEAKDFDQNSPILVISDGMFEADLKIKHKHAYLISKGYRLPFENKQKVFYFE